MFKNLSLKDWLIVGAIVGQAYVVNYRVGQLEKQFAEFRQVYVTKETFDLTIQNLKLQIEAGDLELQLKDAKQHRTYRPATPAPPAKKEDDPPTASYPFFKP